jgi:hypothetical protein
VAVLPLGKHPIGQSSAAFEAAHEGADLLYNLALIAGPEPVIVAIELDEARSRYCAGQMPAGLDADRAVAMAMEDERRRDDTG